MITSVKSILYFACLVAVFPTVLVAQTTDLEEMVVDRIVEKAMESQGIVGMAIGVIEDGALVYSQGYGWADVESKIPVTTKTVFNWASNSKPLMAVAALQLVDLDKLDLDKSVREIIPTLPKSMQAITARHLLCHQSGIPHYSNGIVLQSEKHVADLQRVDPLVAIHRFINSPLLYEPGSKMTYSSYAYVLLSAVVQVAGREPIEKQLKKRIGEVIGFESFQLDLPYTGQKNWTLAYQMGNRGAPSKIEDTAHFWKHGAGGYKSDVLDFSRWAIALMDHRLLSAETEARMWTPQSLTSSEPTDFGLGVRVSGKEKALKIQHSGSQDETKTQMVLYPNQRRGIVVMCNSNEAKPAEIGATVLSALEGG